MAYLGTRIARYLDEYSSELKIKYYSIRQNLQPHLNTYENIQSLQAWLDNN